MPTLPEALAELRELVLSPGLIRAEGRGRRRDATPSVSHATIRPVQLKSGPMLQIVTDDGIRPTTRNVSDPAEIDKLLAEPFGSWVVETTGETVSLQTTKKGAILHRHASSNSPSSREHDRLKEHLLDPGDPLFAELEADARKRRQVDAFLRQLDVQHLPKRMHIVDLGCGNAYLTFAAYAYLNQLGFDVSVTGVDVREDQRLRNTALARRLGWSANVRFVAGEIATVEVEPVPDMVFALHACDTATDDALARAVSWGAKWILAAPCCHKDVSRQLRSSPQRLLIAHGIMRERFADVLTDVIRAGLLREQGYDVEILEFIDSKHTPRNAMIRAVKSRNFGIDPAVAELIAEWGVEPALARRLPSPG